MQFQSKLEMGRIFDGWLEQMQRKDWGWTGPLYTARVVYTPLAVANSPGGKSALSANRKLELCANFDMACISFHKQVSHLQWAKIPVPHLIVQASLTMKRLYPCGVAMHEIIKAVRQAEEELRPSYCASLVHEVLEAVQRQLLEGASLTWSTLAQVGYSFPGGGRGVYAR
jgi:hypothetical protein